MKSITVSRITEEIDQNVLIQLMELIGPIESFFYSDDNTQAQFNYNEEIETEKALEIINNIQVNGISLIFSEGTIEENIDKKEMKNENEENNENKENEKESKMSEVKQFWEEFSSKLKEGMCEFWTQLNEKVQFKEYYENVKIQLSAFNEKHQISEKVSNTFNGIVTKCKEILPKQKPEETELISNEDKTEKIIVEDDEGVLEDVDSEKLNE